MSKSLHKTKQKIYRLQISEIDLAIANLFKREKDGTLKKSDSLQQQALEMQKKVAEIQKKSVAVKKIEALG